MITITGNVLNATDAPLHVLVSFTLQSPPLVQATGKVIAPPAVNVKTNSADGSFSVQLEPGVYLVTCASIPSAVIYILVPASGGPYTIDQVQVATPAVAAYTPSGAGSPQGAITGSPGATYWDAANTALYIKVSGNGTTGWQLILQL